MEKTRFAEAIEREYADMLRRMLLDINRVLFVGPLPPVYGPPAPTWYELELDRILANEQDAEHQRRAIVTLLDRVDEAGRDW